jgi:hypothetical protein
MNIAIISLAIGIILLLLGRKLFWLFVGAAGFLAGLDLAERFVTGPDITKLLIALIIGIVGAFLAILFYRVAVAIGGFLIGGYLAVHLVNYFGISVQPSMIWVPYLIGGVIGAILILMLFDWALIILSSFAGASLIVHSVSLRQFNITIEFIVLVIIGILVQAGILLRSRPRTV